MGIQFQYKAFIPLFACIIILALFYVALLYWKKQVKKRMGDEGLINILTATYSSRLSALKFIFLMVAFASGVVAVMNPRKPGKEESTNRKGIDIAIALDVSKSMLATDVAPSRLDRAKQFISKLISSMPNDRFALVLFAGQAYLQMPLTTDHGAANLFVSAANPAAIPQQGTVISDALKRSAAVFSANDNKYKTVILISDGEDHDADATSTAKDLAEQGVMINTVGSGSVEGSTIIDPSTGEIKKDESGRPVISKLNEEILAEIAEGTNGVYTKLESSEGSLAGISKQLSQIDRTSFKDLSRANFKTYYLWFAAGMFVLLLGENFIPEKRRIPIAIGTEDGGPKKIST